MTTTSSLKHFHHRVWLTLTPSVPDYVDENELLKTEKEAFKDYKPNKIEEAGDILLSPFTSLPRAIKYLKNPSAQVVIAGGLIITGVFCAFYPTVVKIFIERCFRFALTSVNLRHRYVKLGGFALGVYTTIGWVVRAVGRFQNAAFEKVNEKPTPPPKPQHQGSEGKKEKEGEA